MLRSALGGIRRGQRRTVIWSPDVADNSKPSAVPPKVCMTDDEASKISDEMAVFRRHTKKQAQASSSNQESSGTTGNSFIFGQQVPMDLTQHSNTFANFTGLGGQSNISNLDLQIPFNTARRNQANTFKIEQEGSYTKGPLTDFAVDQAVQISKLSEDERKRQRALRFGTQSLHNQRSQKSKVETRISHELEQLGIMVDDFIDTMNIYVQVQDAISEASSEMISGRTRAWDYFDDGFKDELETEAIVEPKIESIVTHKEIPRVLEDIVVVDEPELKFESGLTPKSDEPYDDVNLIVEEVQLVDPPSASVILVPDPIEKSPEAVPEEETIVDRVDDNTVVDKSPENSDTDTDEEEIIPAFRFTTFCDLRDEVLGSPLPRSRREVAFKRKASFKKSVRKIKNDREPETERLRRRKDRLAIFDANRANSITKVLSELDSVMNLDTPAECLFRLEHPEYFPKEPTESREERLREYELARIKYDAHVAKLIAKQESRQEKVTRKRLRELEEEEFLREAKKVARQKVQEEMGWTPPSDAEILKWREERGMLPPAEEDEYDEKESDEENVEIYYDPLEELPEPKVLRSSPRRSEKVLSYSELRRRARERERNKKVQSELAKMQETARKFQIENLRHQVLEEEHALKRQKLVDLSNERDRLDTKAIQHVREIAASKIAIGRAIRELEDKIAAAEAELSQKKRFEEMVNDQMVYMKRIRHEELQNGTKKSVKWAEERKSLDGGLIGPETFRKSKGKVRRHY